MKTLRNATLDVAKGFSLLFLPAIHSALMYSKPSIRKTITGKFLAFIAEHIGANVFLLLMGVLTGVRPSAKMATLIKQSAKLLGQAYLLNALKFNLPNLLKFFPENFFTDNGIPKGKTRSKELFLTGDILHAAAVCRLVCGLVRKSKYHRLISLTAAFGTIFLSPKLWRFFPQRLLSGQPPKAFFPIFPWMAYVLFGAAVGRETERDINDRKILIVAVALWVLSLLVKHRENAAETDPFYRAYPSQALSHIASAILFIGSCRYLNTRTQFGRLLSFLGRNVTVAYMAQWIVVMWMLLYFGYRKSGVRGVLKAAFINTLLSFLLTAFCLVIKKELLRHVTAELSTSKKINNGRNNL